MKKLFKLMLCLMLCVAPCFAFTACFGNPPADPITQAQAEQMMTTAITNTKAKTAYELKVDMGLMGGITVIVNENGSYHKSNAMGMAVIETWIETEDQVDYDYVMTTMEMEGETEGETETFVMYEKTISEGLPMSLEEISMEEGTEGATFVSATVENGVTTIVYTTTEDDETMTMTITIENELLTSMTVAYSNGMVVTAIQLKYDDAVVLPGRPTHDAEDQPIVWEEETVE